MGWKAVRDHYKIEHTVLVTEAGICIGSPYIHNIIVINFDGIIVKPYDGRGNEDLKRYQAEMDADPALLKQLVQQEDTFGETVTVYTYDRGKILEKQCEELGWPNVTTDGQMMYENRFSIDRAEVVRWAFHSAKCCIEHRKERVEEAAQSLAKAQAWLNEAVADLEELNKTEGEAIDEQNQL